jgi:hypothetical protein
LAKLQSAKKAAMEMMQQQQRLLLDNGNGNNVGSNQTTTMTTTTRTDTACDYEYNTTLVFWGVNIFILFLLISACLWCYCIATSSKHQLRRRQESDEIYRQTVLRRQQHELEIRRDSPDQRKRKVLDSFNRCQTRMVCVFWFVYVSISLIVSIVVSFVYIHLTSLSCTRCFFSFFIYE